MVKHNNYANPCKLVIKKTGEDSFVLIYEDESYELVCSEDELLEELREHLQLME